MTAWSIILVVLGAVVSAALIIHSAGLWWLVRATRRELPTLRAGVEAAGRSTWKPPVLVIIPAHNEAHVLPELVASLRAQDYPSFRVVFALDRCTDASADVVRRACAGDARFTVVEIAACEPGWAGKVHAAWVGVRSQPKADDELLLFADADTLFEPACISAAVAMMEARELDLLSLLSSLRHRHWFELVVQPAASLELVRQYPLVNANRDQDRRPFANGQFLLFRKAAYDACGGHEGVKNHLLEDIAFARAIHHRHLRPGILLADGIFHCRMYNSWGRFVKGWKRIFTEAANRRPDRLRGYARRAVFRGVVLPVGTLVALIGSLRWPVEVHAVSQSLEALAALGLLLWLVAMMSVLRSSRGPLWAAPGFIVGSALTGWILARAARDLVRGRPTEWGGKSYDRPVRDSSSDPI